jgi:hypothetical protein
LRKIHYSSTENSKYIPLIIDRILKINIFDHLKNAIEFFRDDSLEKMNALEQLKKYCKELDSILNNISKSTFNYENMIDELIKNYKIEYHINALEKSFNKESFKYLYEQYEAKTLSDISSIILNTIHKHVTETNICEILSFMLSVIHYDKELFAIRILKTFLGRFPGYIIYFLNSKYESGSLSEYIRLEIVYSNYFVSHPPVYASPLLNSYEQYKTSNDLYNKIFEIIRNNIDEINSDVFVQCSTKTKQKNNSENSDSSDFSELEVDMDNNFS